MDVIAGRKTVGEVGGQIFVNGHLKEQRSWSRVMGYCEQARVTLSKTLRPKNIRNPKTLKTIKVTKKWGKIWGVGTFRTCNKHPSFVDHIVDHVSCRIVKPCVTRSVEWFNAMS